MPGTAAPAQTPAQIADGGLQKQAALEKQARDQLLAHDLAVDCFCRDAGIDRAKFAQALGVEDPQWLSEAMIVWNTESARAATQG